jgi:hypothetical protein
MARTAKRTYTQAPVVAEPGIRCPHCLTEGHEHKVLNTYPNGNRRRRCSACAKPFITMRNK